MPSGAPLFSIVVPTFDRPQMLADALSSIRGQTNEDFECIVVDDAGSIPASVPSGDGRFRVVRSSENRGEAASRNAGLIEARGRYVTFLDDDDCFTPDRLAIAELGFSQAPAIICYRSELGDVHRPPSGRMLEGNVFEEILDELTPQMGQVALERSIAPRFDQRFQGMTDVEWWLRLSQTTPVTTVPRVGLLYRTHSGPRALNGIEARIRGSHLLLETRSEYFASHQMALAFRWKRIGLMSEWNGRRDDARAAYLKSLRAKPSAAALKHLARTVNPLRKNPAGK